MVNEPDKYILLSLGWKTFVLRIAAAGGFSQPETSPWHYKEIFLHKVARALQAATFEKIDFIEAKPISFERWALVFDPLNFAQIPRKDGIFRKGGPVDSIRLGDYFFMFPGDVCFDRKAFDALPVWREISTKAGQDGASDLSDDEVMDWIKQRETALGARPRIRSWEENKDFFRSRGVTKARFETIWREYYPNPDKGRPNKK